MNGCYIGDTRDGMRAMIADGLKAQTCVTSPPYWGLRDYGTAEWDGGGADCDHRQLLGGKGASSAKQTTSAGTQGYQYRDTCRKCGASRIDRQIGLEPTIAEYVANMVEVFRLVRDVLADDGTLWLNLGDSYSGSGKGGNPIDSPHQKQATNGGSYSVIGNTARDAAKTKFAGEARISDGLKPKDLCGIPWRVAFALQADGWYLRSEIIWHKLNPMPESVRDRPTKAHEQIFLLSKNPRYYYDADAIMEDCSESTHARISQNLADQIGSYRANGGDKTNGPMKAVVAGSTRKLADAGSGIASNRSYESALAMKVERRNKRSVWSLSTEAYSEAHFATFPPKLIEPCILAGSRVGDVVFDPFMGSGTVGQVAQQLGRKWAGCELNAEYVNLQGKRTAQTGLELHP